MDIHRCRFVPYPPSAINAVAFSHPTATKKSTPVRLAIGRANGDIEIWNPLGGLWHQETVLHGGKDRSIDGLVWVTEPDQVLQDGTRIIGKSRLFSIGYTTTVTEWDLEKLRPKKQASGMHGDIWCLGVQPPAAPPKDGDKAKSAGSARRGRKLVAGTMDGSLVLYSIDDDDLQFERVLVKSTTKKTKMVSIAFQSRNIAVVGCSDSSIRVYDTRSGSILRKMTLGADLAGGAKEIIVWSVKCLEGGDIVSGDSTGHVCIWDGKTYTQAQRLQSHKQDVLSLSTSADGSMIISGGMDRRTVLYRKSTGSGTRWGKVWHRRYHSHDVKTLASFEGQGMSVLVSGGPDSNPIVLPLQKAGMENHRALSYLPQDPPLKSASKSRLIVSWWDREVHIWRLRRPLKDLLNNAEGESNAAKNRKLVARILIKGEANIASAAISEDGSLLVVSTTSEIKAFHLKPRDDGKRDEFKISKVELPEAISTQGATKTQISPDGQWLCVIRGGSIVSVLRIVRDSESSSKPTIHPKAIRLQRIERKIPKHISFGGLGQYDRTITQVTFSPDSKMLAVADLEGYIDSWILGHPRPKLQNGVNGTRDDESVNKSESDSEEDDEIDPDFDLRWTRNPNGSLIPKLQAAPTVLCFSNHIPTAKASFTDDETPDDYILLAITARPQILTIHPTLGALTPWSRRNPISKFPVEFRNVRDLVKGALWSGERVWLYGNNFLFMFDLSQDLAEPTTAESTSGGELVQHGKKRKREPDSGAGSKTEIGAAGPTKLLRYAQGAEAQEVPLDAPVSDPMDEDGTSQAADESESEDSDEEAQGELALLRGAQGKSTSCDSTPSSGLPFWHTYKYRPILGIVPFVEEAEELVNGDTQVVAPNGVSPPSLEVALVERPLWDVDMIDRYYGDGEFER
ncbi:quinon protein alcohol dehydrogenase-like superfamily [Biscogniauxia sp. FL1348]|nr:quinon protein alcohol dehydrogenase-like superfamily [Biscogniauxia sp. FL1348]